MLCCLVILKTKTLLFCEINSPAKDVSSFLLCVFGNNYKFCRDRNKFCSLKFFSLKKDKKIFFLGGFCVFT